MTLLITTGKKNKFYKLCTVGPFYLCISQLSIHPNADTNIYHAVTAKMVLYVKDMYRYFSYHDFLNNAVLPIYTELKLC